MVDRPAFTIGIEEEYLVVDRETRDLVKDPSPDLWDSLREVLGPQVAPEFLKAQIEVGTKVCAKLSRPATTSPAFAVTSPAWSRNTGLRSSPPRPTPSPTGWSRNRPSSRGISIAADYQVVARQMVICGMHVHVGSRTSTFVST